MNIDLSKLALVDIEFYSGDIPAPYCHTYKILVEYKKGLQTSFELKYLDREDLSEDEIYMEGFTPNDDVNWQGTIPTVWADELKELITKTTWVKNKFTRNAEESVIRVTMMDNTSKTFEGTPSDIRHWESFNQELIQAIYEISRKERPLCVRFLRNKGKSIFKEFSLKASFEKREIQFEVNDNGEISQKHVPWKNLKDILKHIYAPDFIYENAKENKPKKRGDYIDIGEELWYKLGEGVVNNNNKYDALAELINIFEEPID
ncbi:hypothetical protein [Aureibacter tunicatorum]|uniref:Uncharacterized protein n=1 Tax=Aureibacter tunicatorum TaxID=866807 RepID=A0AAE4BSU6_9BACT|nr:hypothetical protein [Aureibacter tunicatorum]MDR6239188.1 hypothetical protein [Aureibacter tunicatorum]BDD04886.1 hypothetical protein AUTU_23690 [Aureibacter tunicatorum]